MKSFTYAVRDTQGIHARPAGMLSRQAAKYQSTVVLKKGEHEVNVRKVIGLMGLCVKKGDEVTITVDGEDEEVAVNELKTFFEQNL